MLEDFEKNKWTSGPFSLLEIDLFVEIFCNQKSIYSERENEYIHKSIKKLSFTENTLPQCELVLDKICAKSKGGEENLTPMV